MQHISALNLSSFRWKFLHRNLESMSLLIDVLLAIKRRYQNLSLRYQIIYAIHLKIAKLRRHSIGFITTFLMSIKKYTLNVRIYIFHTCSVDNYSLVTKYGREYSDFKEPNKIKYFSYLPTHPKNSESPEGKPTYFLIFAVKWNTRT